MPLPDLKPEEKKALGFLLDNFHSLSPSIYVTQQIWNQGTTLLIQGPFSTKAIPFEPNWRWNQTRAKNLIHPDSIKASVQITKLVPRKKQPTPTPPRLKIWLFDLCFFATKMHCHVLWCEKGYVQGTPSKVPQFVIETKISQVVETPSFSDLRLDDFSFLSEFMDPETANTFWPSKVTNPNP